MNYPYILNEKSLLLDAVKLLEKSRKTIVPVLNVEQKLLGIVSDGDIRRALLNGAGLHSAIYDYMNSNPSKYIKGEETYSPHEIIQAKNIEALPIVDENNTFLDIISIHDEEFFTTTTDIEITKNVSAFILAGGEGTRLRPITEKVPKPMVEFAGKPLLEHQIKKLVSEGISSIEISINYLGHIIEDYFKEGKTLGANLTYIKELEKRGTAGSITYSNYKNNKNLIVINGDVVTKVSYQKIIKHHIKTHSDLTVACTAYSINIPYGVVKTDGVHITSIEEKPTQSLLCNAGIYILSSKASALIPNNTFYNMTDLIKSAMESNLNVVAYPMHEYWSDIGTFEELESARQRWKNDESHKR